MGERVEGAGEQGGSCIFSLDLAVPMTSLCLPSRINKDTPNKRDSTGGLRCITPREGSAVMLLEGLVSLVMCMLVPVIFTCA